MSDQVNGLEAKLATAFPVLWQEVAVKKRQPPRDEILELACPFEQLGLREEEEVSFSLTVYRKGAAIQRAPENTAIVLRVPSRNFEQIMWRV